MKFADAKKLHNEDEVVSKETGESIRVLSVKTVLTDDSGASLIEVEGVGKQTGYGVWSHREVR